MSHRALQTVALCLLLLLLIPLSLPAQQVLHEARLGCYTEDLDYVSKGPHANQIVIIDGLRILGVPAGGTGMARVKELFRVDHLPAYHLNGIAWIESEKLFAINSDRSVDKLYLVDHKGQLKETRTIQYLNGYLPTALEALAYVPATAKQYPDHLVFIAGSEDRTGRLEIMRRDGQVVKELMFGSYQPGSVAYHFPDLLLVSGAEGDWTKISVVDFDGNIVASKVITESAVEAFEGIVETASGLIVGAGTGGVLYFYDQGYGAIGNRTYAPDLGLHGTRGIAWNSATQKYVVYDWNRMQGTFDLHAIPWRIDSADKLATVGWFSPRSGYTRLFGLTYIANEERIAGTHYATSNSGGNPDFVPPSIVEFSVNGNWVGTTDLTSLGLGQPYYLAHIPSTGQFAVTFDSSWTKIHIVSGDGTSKDHTISLNLANNNDGFLYREEERIRGLAYFHTGSPGGDRLLVGTGDGLGAIPQRLLVIDLDGNVLSEFNAEEALGVYQITDLATVTNGPHAGAFAVLDYTAGGELVVFRLK